MKKKTTKIVYLTKLLDILKIFLWVNNMPILFKKYSLKKDLPFSEDEFQSIQQDFLDKHWSVFEPIEENKLVYMDIFQNYVCFSRKIAFSKHLYLLIEFVYFRIEQLKIT